MRFQIKGVKREQYEKYLELIPDLKREKAQKYITIVLTLITTIILSLFAINPTFSTIANLQKQIDDGNFVEQKLQQKINNLAILQEKYGSIQPSLLIVDDAIPTSTQIPLFIAEAQSIAQDSSLALTSLQTSEVNLSDLSIKGNDSFDFNTTATGTYQNMITFLEQMTTFQRVIALKSIILSTQNGTLQLSLKGTVFYKQ
jgi:Tfp pilus assembly protein PilO